MNAFHVPGVAFGMTSSKGTLYASTYGYRDLDKKLPMTTETMMAVASNTKSFTGLMMGILVDQKKLSWHDTVMQHLPEWKMYNHEAAEQITIQDLLLHCSGLPRYDLAWLFKTSTAEVIQSIKFLQESEPFRKKFQYQNIMYAAASYLQEKVAQAPWHKLIRSFIFEPAGMNASSALSQDLYSTNNFSLPYVYEDGSIDSTLYRDISHIAGAGSIVSNLHDMMSYVRYRLNLCQNKNNPVISIETANYLQQKFIDVGDYFNGKINGFYGIGVFVKELYGHRLVYHTGSIDGFLSSLCWLPDDDIGIVVMSNSSSYDTASVIQQSILDILFHVEQPQDWVRHCLHDLQKEEMYYQKIKEDIANTKKKSKRTIYPLNFYVGNYHHSGYGHLEIVLKDGNLILIFGNFILPLEHIYENVFYTTFNPGGLFSNVVRLKPVIFVDKNKKIHSLSIPLEPSMPPLHFQRTS